MYISKPWAKLLNFIHVVKLITIGASLSGTFLDISNDILRRAEFIKSRIHCYKFYLDNGILSYLC